METEIELKALAEKLRTIVERDCGIYIAIMDVADYIEKYGEFFETLPWKIHAVIEKAQKIINELSELHTYLLVKRIREENRKNHEEKKE